MKDNSVKKQKKLAAENLRQTNYENRRDQLLNQGYTQYIGVISVAKANAMAFVTAGPFALAIVILYLLAHQGFAWHIRWYGLASFIIAIILSIPLHEFIHGLTWHFFCKEKWRSIHFGVMWDTLTPYCHCKEPLSFGAYIAGGLAPFFLLGLVPGLIGVVLGSMFWLWLGIFNILCAGGDTTICWLLRKYSDCLILDHYKECGFVAFRKS